MNALGSPVHWRLVIAYTISAAVAGIAGALFAQTNAFVTLGVFDFDQSAAVLVMLILGGAGWLYGAFIGAALYMVLQNELAKASPAFWQFGIGLLLIVRFVLFARRGPCTPKLEHRPIVALADPAMTAATAPALKSATCERTSARLKSPAASISRFAARRPPRLDRTERRRQNHARQSDHRPGAGIVRPGLARRRGDDLAVASGTHPPRHRAHLSGQPALSATSPCWKTFYLAIGERTGACNRLWRSAGGESGVIEEALDHLQSLALVSDACRPVRELPYGRQRLVEIAIALAQRPKLLLLDEPAAGVPSSESHLILDVISQARSEHRRADYRARHGRRVPLRQADHRPGRRSGADRRHAGRDFRRPRVRAIYLGEKREAPRG